MSATAPKASARTIPVATPRRVPSARNGSQSTTVRATSSSAAGHFQLREALRAFLLDHPGLSSDEASERFVASLDPTLVVEALHQALRRYLQTLAGSMRRDAWGDRGAEGKSPAGSARWQQAAAAHKDGSLESYRKIVDAEVRREGRGIRFGALDLEGVEWMIDIRQRQQVGLKRELARLLKIHTRMRTDAAATIDDLPPEWLLTLFPGVKVASDA